MAIGLIVYDLLLVTLAAAVYGAAGYGAIEVGGRVAAHAPLPLAVVTGLVAFLVAVIVQIGVLTALMPRLRPGRYDMMKGAVFWSWLLRSLLRRVLFLPPLKTLLFSSNVLRFLSLRALGARTAFTANMSSDVDLLDPALLTVGPGATIGTRCLLSGHFVDKGQLVLGEIVVGPGTLLAAEVLVGPSVTFGERARVLAQASFGPDVIVGAGATVGGRATVEGENRIADGARIGTEVFVGKGRDVAGELLRGGADDEGTDR